MRLLKRSQSGDLELESFDDDDHAPPYAILSHTWTIGQELTYNELVSGAGRDKTGYAKIRFCMDRAAEDQLQYSWVDTCCIDKSTSDEVNTAINSMFRWYQRAQKCYVYLSDVRVPAEVTDASAFPITWAEAFRRSRWFTRGWTLQELLAPPTVELFSWEGKRLGSKISLEREIHEITRIPVRALRAYSLASFSIEERMSWAANRTTTIKEDRAYCLLGVFGVFLPLIYGEGHENAMLRLNEEIRRRQEQRGSESAPDHVDSLAPPQAKPPAGPTSPDGARKRLQTPRTQGSQSPVSDYIRLIARSPWTVYPRHFTRNSYLICGGTWLGYERVHVASAGTIEDQASLRLRSFQNQNIAQIVSIFHYEKEAYIAYESIEITLREISALPSKEDGAEIAFISREIMRGLQYCHQVLGIAYGDANRELDCTQVRVSSKGGVKIANIGAALLANRNSKEQRQRDTRSVGLIMVELMEPSTSVLYPDSLKLQIPERWTSEALEFLSDTGSKTLAELLQHPFLNGAVGARLSKKVDYARLVVGAKLEVIEDSE